MKAAAILDFFRSHICNGPNNHEGGTASPCQISLKSLKLWPRYGDISIFQNGGGRHVGFLKLQSSNCETHHKCRIASLTMPNFVAIGQIVVEISRFWIIQDGGSHHLGFFKYYILTIRTVKKDELRRCAKFCLNRSNQGGDMSVCDFSRWRPPPS